jgi:hypothetical protein
MAGARRGFPPARFEGVGIFGVGIFSPTGSIPDDKAQIDGRVFSACEAEPAESATDPGTRWAAAIEVWPVVEDIKKILPLSYKGSRLSRYHIDK